KLLMQLKRRQGLKPRHLELIIVVTSKLKACSYCLSHHAPRLAVECLSQAAIDQLPQAEHAEFDAIDRLVIEYAVAGTQAPRRIAEALFERLRQHFSDPGIRGLTLPIALCGAHNPPSEALQIAHELAEPVAVAGIP